MSDLWVFAYGSLMWHPGFPFEEVHHAVLAGYHRALCLYSIRYRGSSERPGLVFGLDRGGICEGLAFRIAPTERWAAWRYLQQRELQTYAYRAIPHPVQLQDGSGRRPLALCFIVNRASRQYAGRLPLATQADVVRHAEGATGCNLGYVLNTAQHLAELGIRDRNLERLIGLVGRWRRPRDDGWRIPGVLRCHSAHRPPLVPILPPRAALKGWRG
jgi:cation transport protein ChaC